ncbi:MAG: nicotinate-nucleotide adenylyltransferase [Bacillota bacterium]|nr:nicotinate-nucleotide adenylyltransferase [Bacillota bacterium]
MSKIGLYGGSFDPIHKGHIKAALTALNKAGLDKIIFLPSGISPHKASLKGDKYHRYNMVKIGIQDEKNFLISDYETKKTRRCFSYETVIEFKKFYSNDELYFVIGDDEYESFNTWYKSNELLELCKFLVITRSGVEINPPFIGICMEPCDISSTEIRQGIKENRDVSDMLPFGVYEYILKHNLYK